LVSSQAHHIVIQILGIWWPALGVAAGIALVVYFVGAIVLHLRVRDIKGVGPAVFMLVIVAGALVLRLLTYKPVTPIL